VDAAYAVYVAAYLQDAYVKTTDAQKERNSVGDDAEAMHPEVGGGGIYIFVPAA